MAGGEGLYTEGDPVEGSDGWGVEGGCYQGVGEAPGRSRVIQTDTSS
jgi:hypothetical protein